MKDPDLDKAIRMLQGRETSLTFGECVDLLILLERAWRQLDSIEEVTFYRYKEDIE